MNKFSPILRTLARQPLQGQAFPRQTTRYVQVAIRAFHHTPSQRNTVQSQPHLLPEFSLKDKVIVVSGGARGLGLVQIEALLEAGATVHAVDRLPSPVEDPKSNFSQVSDRGRELGTSLHYHQVDVRDVPSLNRIFEDIANGAGRLDGLIAAAGINHETPAIDYSMEETERMMSINFTGAFMTAQAAARQMIRLKQPGSIVMIASMSATIANKGMLAPVYNPSKAAVVQLARNLAMEWGEHGIRVNTLSPGYILTQMLQNLFNDYPDRRESWPKENMLGRLSTPEEYRGAAVFLLSDASSFMTGADLRMDGGHAAW
ncbi:D-arabinitol 2-dehydrogenase [Fusarium pseudocircinatum]|uniref:D-arabinitol 2-dehydrogenase n=1 Tax=Fusarium pseudocircinatum TaxID=56676 RepID=A0A8H5UPE3_9HYPO|nr:D-arabinitol 2-dehydrogenase [Fusarium pseudocircinatum]